MSLPSIDGVDERILLQRVHRGLDEEAHEAELHAVLLLEPVLVALAQFDDRLHVHFVEGGEDRGGRLRLHQPLGDALRAAATSAPVARAVRRGRGAASAARPRQRRLAAGAAAAAAAAARRAWRAPRRRRSRRPWCTRPPWPVPATEPAVDAVFGHHLGRRRHRGARLLPAAAAAAAGAAAAGVAAAAAAGAASAAAGAACAAGLGVDPGDHLVRRRRWRRRA